MLEKLKKEFPSIEINDQIKKGKVDRDLIFEKKGFFQRTVEAVILFVNSCLETDITGVSAQMAFIILFALLPTLFFIFLICSRFINNFEEYFFEIIDMAIPSASSEYLKEELSIFLSYLSRYKIIITVLSALMGTLSAHTLVIGLNKTYGFKRYDSRKWEWIKSFVMLLSLIAVLVGVLYLFFISTFTFENINNTINIKIQDNIIIDTTSYISGLGALFFILLGTYTFTPYRRIPVKEAIPGTVFAIISILIVFQIYVRILNNSLNYLALYGSMSGLFILLTALFFLSLMINLGAKVNVFFAKKTH